MTEPRRTHGPDRDATQAETPAQGEAEPTQAEAHFLVESLSFLDPPHRPGSLGRLAHYEILEVLGKGGFGTVYKAFDDKLHRTVAIKVLAPELAATSTARVRFLREARAAAAVRDEHVVDIHDVNDQPAPYLVMEYIAGTTLHAKLAKAGPLEVEEILRIGHQVARGLAAAHKHGKIHRDIKPSNILLEEGVRDQESRLPTPVRAKISDFGLARAMDDANLTQSGVIAGTPAYMSPEQAEGEAIDHRSDLFSLGTVLYVMCTGQPPFRATGTMAVLKRVCHDIPRPIREINPGIPEWLADIIGKLHAKNPAERYQSAQEVADVLAKCLAEIHTHDGVLQAPARVAGAEASRLPDEPAPVSRPPSRGGSRAGIMTALVGVVLVGVALALWNRAALVQLLFPPPIAPPIPPKAEWVQLFNGKDLTGWQAMGWNGWTVKDDVLVGDTMSGKPGWLRTEREFSDFELELEFKLGDKTDSGVFLRAWPEGNLYGDDFTEVQLIDDRHLPKLAADRKHGAVFKQAALKVPVSAEAGAWQRLRIRAVGQHVRVWQENVELVDHLVAGGRAKGSIGLQLFPTHVEFRNIRIREMESR